MKAPPRATVLSRLRRGLVLGLIWAVAITASEMLVLPFGRMGSIEQLVVFWPIFVDYCISGVLMACAAIELEPIVDRPWRLACAAVLLCALGATLNSALQVILHALEIPIAYEQLLGDKAPSLQYVLYSLWMHLFHGSPFVAACVLVTRGQRKRELLGSAQIARNTTEALLEEVQLEALRAQVDPGFLLRAMAAIQARYGSDVASAGQLLDQLVAFLRSAMPGVRSGASTLAAELKIARAYAQLCASIDPGRTAWRVQVPRQLPALPFPPLLLLPLIDQLTIACTGQTHGRLQVTHVDGQVNLFFRVPFARPSLGTTDTPTAALPSDMMYSMQVALQRACGSGFTLALGPGAPPHDALFTLVVQTQSGRNQAVTCSPAAALAAPSTLPHFQELQP